MKFQQKVVGLLYNPPNGTITYGNKNRQGYMNIMINREEFRIHRLVAYIYIDNSDKVNKTIVNHINKEKDDNAIENLQWCTLSENRNHSKTTKKIQCEYIAK